MATILIPTDGFSSRYDGTKRDSYILLDRFWDSLYIPMSEPTNIDDSPNSIGSFNYAQPRVRTPEIFTKGGCTPVLNIKSLQSSMEHRCSNKLYNEESTIASRRRTANSRKRATLRILIDYTGPDLKPQRSHSETVVSRPLGPGERATRRPKLSIPRDPHQLATGITSPVTAVFSQASRFLSNIVKRGRSRPSSPVGTVYSDCEDVRVLGSEVTINVADDSVRTAHPSDFATNRYGMIDILGIPYAPEEDEIWSAGIPHLSIDGNEGPGSAREVGAISKLCKDRELLRARSRLQRVGKVAAFLYSL